MKMIGLYNFKHHININLSRRKYMIKYFIEKFYQALRIKDYLTNIIEIFI